MKMSIRAAYNLLGLTCPTNLRNVKIRFRRLAKKYHPDVNDDENASLQFQNIYMAYETILESLGESSKTIESEFADDLTWFYEWHRDRRIKADMDPFEVRYEHYWMPKIAKMLENLKKQKMKKKDQ
ncbi:MAG: DnaJ domain-containing protein [Promethearchaeota archaeon]